MSFEVRYRDVETRAVYLDAPSEPVFIRGVWQERTQSTDRVIIQFKRVEETDGGADADAQEAEAEGAVYKRSNTY